MTFLGGIQVFFETTKAFFPNQKVLLISKNRAKAFPFSKLLLLSHFPLSTLLSFYSLIGLQTIELLFCSKTPETSDPNPTVDGLPIAVVKKGKKAVTLSKNERLRPRLQSEAGERRAANGQRSALTSYAEALLRGVPQSIQNNHFPQQLRNKIGLPTPVSTLEKVKGTDNFPLSLTQVESVSGVNFF